MIKLAFLSLVILLTGCATNSLTPKPITSANLNETQGLFVGTFSRAPNAPKYYSQTFYFKNATTGKIFEVKSQPTFNMFTGKTPDDFNTQESNGALFVQTLPAGKYIYNNFRLYQSNGSYQQNWSSVQDYAIPFEIFPNKVNYGGEIKLVPVMGKNFFNMNVQAGGTWVISDQHERDIPLFKSKYPSITFQNYENVIPEGKEIFTPLIVLPSEQNKI